MNTQNQNKLRRKAVALKPMVRVGKNGLSVDVFDEINKQLDKKR